MKPKGFYSGFVEFSGGGGEGGAVATVALSYINRFDKYRGEFHFFADTGWLLKKM